MATLTLTSKLNSVAADVQEIVLEDPTGSYGIKETISGDIMIAAGTAISQTDTGEYQYVYDEPNIGTQYTAYVKYTTTTGTILYQEIPWRSTTDAVIVLPSEVVAMYLINTLALFTNPDEDADWPLFIGHCPDANDVPDDCGVIYLTTGIFDGKGMRAVINQHYGIQIRVRTRTETQGYSRMGSIEEVFKSVHNEDIILANGDTWRIRNFHQATPIVPLGVDDQRRYHHTINMAVSMYKVS
jgi:hypothetical protein